MFGKLVKPIGVALMGWAMSSGESVSAQPPPPPPPAPTAPFPVANQPPVTLGYAEPTSGVFASAPPSATAPGVWFNIDYVLWWLKAAPAPGPLLTGGSGNDLVPGALGQPGTVVVLGNDGYSNNAFNGLRLNVGTWINENRTYGYEVAGFVLEHRNTFQSARSRDDGSPFLAQPFFNTLTNAEDSALVSFPNFQTGGTALSASTRFSGWDANFLANGSDDGSFRADWLAGFRCLYLSERLNIDNIVTSLVDQGGATALRAGESIGSVDRINTSSNFWGPQIGTRLTWVSERWITTATVKVALGVTDQVSVLAGDTTSRGTALIPGGFYVTAGNGGRYYDGAFSVVPEVGLNVGYRICESITLRVGYTALFWSDVVRPGNVNVHALNPTLIPSLQAFGMGPTNQPRATIDSTDFWAQGINLGVEFRF